MALEGDLNLFFVLTMIIEEEEIQTKQIGTAEIPTVPRPEAAQGGSNLRPKCLFPPEENPADRSKRPATTEPLKKRKHVKDS